MFERLYVCPRAIVYHRTCPMVEERRWYLAHLLHQGYARGAVRTVAGSLLSVMDLLGLDKRRGETILVDEVEEKAAAWSDCPAVKDAQVSRVEVRSRFLRVAKGWLRFLGRLQERETSTMPAQYTGRHAEYVECMRQDRGMAESTIAHRSWNIRDFLTRMTAANRTLEELSIEDIDKVFASKISDCLHARISVRHYATCLRGFFRFAESRGWCRAGLSDGIVAPRVYAQETLPTGPTWEDVRRLLASVAGEMPSQIRDRAILVLLSVYGFRAGEVLRLRLDDIDWEQEQILLTRPKVRRAQPYPLCQTAADAIVRYLKHVRPRSDLREVFLTLRPPFRPLTNAALYKMVGPRLKQQGVTLPHYGPHALRHACATHLMEEGLSLKEIGDHLGHRHPDTTRIYTKVHITALRDVGDFDLEGLV